MSRQYRPRWEPLKLNELGFVGRGKSKHRPRNDPSLYGGHFPFFQTGDIKAADLYLREYSQTYNEKGVAQSKLWKPGTLCITIAANIADTAILELSGCFPDSVVGFIADKSKADVRFVKYYIDTIKIQMQSASLGTTQDNLSLDKLLSFNILTPPLPTQQKIASILSAYDELIENNTRRIKILEEMAQAIYRAWFVHFRYPGHKKAKMVKSPLGQIPEGWFVAKLSDLADINAMTIKRGEEPAEIVYIDIASVSTGSVDEPERMSFSEAPSRARRIVRDGDIIWSTVRPNRRSYSLILDPEPNLVVSTGFAVISCTTAPFTYLYHALTTDEFVSYLTNHATGAAYPAVNSKDFEDAQIVRPPRPLLDHFHNTTEPILALRNVLARRTNNLRVTRDLLLPRLISGDIDVSDLDIDTGDMAA